MSSIASRRSADAKRESLKRQADRAQALMVERDELVATLIQAKALLDVGDISAAKNALAVAPSIEALPARAIDLMGFAADFSELCVRRKVRAAWFTTHPDESDPTGNRVTVSTGGEAHHEAMLGLALDQLAHVHALKAGERPHILLTPDDVASAFPARAPTSEAEMDRALGIDIKGDPT